MRRSSYTPIPPEPLIVVEEADGSEDEQQQQQLEGEEEHRMDVAGALQRTDTEEEEDTEPESMYLCPWRDARDLRKRSLPTPSCSSGITASQVRRLSERSAASARESAFLATLTSAAAPGRRHSVNISRIPPSIYPGSGCRGGRRESIAAFPNRRDSAAASFSLHRDIMDDITEVKSARKAKMKLYKSSSREQVCELYESPVLSLRAPNVEARRHSDSAGLVSLMPPAIPPRRKSSEQYSSGIVCTDQDLAKLLSLTSSAQELPQQPRHQPAELSLTPGVLRENRSNSFDISMLSSESEEREVSSWFAQRHQPMSVKKAASPPPPAEGEGEGEGSQVVWDTPSGSLHVDAERLGSAIEVYLRRGGEDTDPPPPPLPHPSPTPCTPKEQEDSKPAPPPPAEACETSICSTFKDLFVK